jgi:predicted MFS family arabinose efflux permease
LRTTWLGLAITSGALTVATWSCWPARAAASTAVSQAAVQSRQLASGAVAVLYAEYALMAIGLVPAMVFLVDFVTRGSGAGSQRGTLLWILYGIGSILGPPLYGQLADRAGARTTVRALLTLQVIAVVALARSSDVIVLGVLSLIIGSFPPGIVPMVLAWIRELHPGDQQQQDRIWSRATIAFAAFQALAAYAYSAVFAFSGGSYRLIFLLGAGSLAIAVLLDLIGNSRPAD